LVAVSTKFVESKVPSAKTNEPTLTSANVALAPLSDYVVVLVTLMVRSATRPLRP
jgi:hypothetical protein